MPRPIVRYAVLAALVLLTACGTPQHAPRNTPPEPQPRPGSTSAAAPVTTARPTTAARSSTPAAKSSTRRATPARPRPTPTVTTSSAHRAASAATLPLRYSTGTAGQVITVTAPSTSSTTATVQAWSRSGTGWKRVGPAIAGHVGSDGLTTHGSEQRSATPMGSFTLTQAFGALADPGTALPYFRTDPADWWISQAGPLYNTHQHCASGCAFTQGAPNEHLYFETPYYDYAVVIDYNTANAPGGVQQGAGSAIFLHVTDGTPTAGCVAIPRDDLVQIMRWLRPAAHPRILIGTA